METPDVLDVVRHELPLHTQSCSFPAHKRIGLVIVDEQNGFCTVGFGVVAPTSHNQQISRMVDETDKLAREFSARGWPMLVTLDTHDADTPERPYPPHCIRGSGEEELVPALQWLYDDENVSLLRKDCVNGFIGGLRADGTNHVTDWVKHNEIQMMLVVGICTDYCVFEFVASVLSARNHGILPPLEEVLLYSEGCSTRHLPKELADGVDWNVAHPQGLTHHMGLYMCKCRGASIIDKIIF